MVLAAPIILNIAKNILQAVKGPRRSKAGLKWIYHHIDYIANCMYTC